MPRYAAMIVRNWNRDDTEYALCTSATLIDSTLTGGPWESPWMVYCDEEITGAQFDLIAANSDVRALDQSYRLAGLVCEEDPPGVVQTNDATGAECQVPAISM